MIFYFITLLTSSAMEPEPSPTEHTELMCCLGSRRAHSARSSCCCPGVAIGADLAWKRAVLI